MYTPKSRRVRILNPASGPGYTSKAAALKYVKRGGARWVGEEHEAIEFIESDARHQMVVAIAMKPAIDKLPHAPVRHSPTPPVIEINVFAEDFRTFARYPLPDQRTAA